MNDGSSNVPRSGPGLTTPWLATRLGLQSAHVEAMRRAGELFGVLPPGGRSYVYPAWQFGRDGKPRPVVRALVAEARRLGVDENRLDDLLSRRVGLKGEQTLVDLALQDEHTHVLDAIRAEAARK